MCTNRDLVRTMECYMDDLIDSFQDFVNKSLVMLSVGACTLVAMLFYVVKLITERRVPVVSRSTSRVSCTNIPKVCPVIPKPCAVPPKPSAAPPKACAVPLKASAVPPKECVAPEVCSNNINVKSSIPKVCSRRRSDMFTCNKDMACASVACDLPLTSSQDERVLREFRFNNCVNDCEMKKRDICPGTSARISVPSLPTSMPNCMPKQTCTSSAPKHCARNLIRSSCCSFCCDKDKI